MSDSISGAGDLGLLLRMRVGTATLVARTEAARAEPAVAAAIPGDDSLLLLFAPGSAAAERLRVARRIAEISGGRTRRGTLHHIEVSFAEEYAPDLPFALDALGLGRDAFLDTLARLTLRVRLLGFRPGFSYLEGLPREWVLPRRATPRAKVAAGSFAVAGRRAGFYALESPGGWNLLGRTDAVLWDHDRERPNLLAPGDEVRIVAAERRLDVPRLHAAPGPELAVLEIVTPATLAVLCGAPDPERSAWGLPVGGPFDVEAAAIANRNVGNPEDATVLECALTGPRLRALGRAVVGWAGAEAPIRAGGRPVRDPRQVELRPGDEIEIGSFTSGARGYLALEGGFAPPHPRELPPVVGRGARLAAGGLPRSPAHFRAFRRGTPTEIAAIAGPDALRAAWRRAIEEPEWRVAARSDRMGVRFEAPVPVSRLPSALPSAALQFGTVQWHPDGDLVAMGPDHPVTGGYLQPMTIPSSELWKLAQLRPGDAIRWRLVGSQIAD